MERMKIITFFTALVMATASAIEDKIGFVILFSTIMLISASNIEDSK